MKKILFTAVSALALASFADGVASTAFGAMKIYSSTTNTVVSVPWLESGTGDAAVSVSNLVLTAGLTLGDVLYVYDDNTGEYTDSWVLRKDGWEASEGGTSIVRGKAIILERQNPDTGYFYIMGKPYSGAEGFVALLGGTPTQPAYSLIAPPSVADVDINTGMTWEGIHKFDSIIMHDGASLVWSNGNWYKRDASGDWTKDGITIPMGRGVWFVAKDNKDTKRFKLGK